MIVIVNLITTRLTNDNVDGDGFSWSPDSKHIVYSYYNSNDRTLKNSTLWIIDVQSGTKRQITYNNV